MLSLFVYNRNKKNAVHLNERCVGYIKSTDKQLDKNECFDDPSRLISMTCSFGGKSLYMIRRDDSKLEKIAESIRLSNDRNYIVLVLQSPDEMFDAVTPSVRPSGFLLEDTDDVRLERLIDEIYADHERMNELISRESYSFKISGKEFSASFCKIMLIEVQSKKIKFHTDSQIFEFYDSLESVMNSAPDYFLRIHRSYVVNANYIKEVNYKERTLLMKDESQIFFSRNYCDNLKEFFKNTLKVLLFNFF